VFGCVLFTATMIGAALAPSLPALVAFRVLQGAGAGLIFPVGIALVTNGYPPDRRARALGLTFALANIGTALGPFLGGGMAQGPGWRWIFWLLVPFSTAAALVALRYVPESRDESASRRVDLPGAAIVAAGVAAISFGVDRAGHRRLVLGQHDRAPRRRRGAAGPVRRPRAARRAPADRPVAVPQPAV
jgi:MFS family permease